MPVYDKDKLEEDISIHIFSVSAAMVGVCLTVVGIIRIIISTRSVGTLADDLLAVDALLFLVSCFLAYIALRARSRRRMYRLERAADYIFIFALLLTALATALIAYALV